MSPRIMGGMLLSVALLLGGCAMETAGGSQEAVEAQENRLESTSGGGDTTQVKDKSSPELSRTSSDLTSGGEAEQAEDPGKPSPDPWKMVKEETGNPVTPGGWVNPKLDKSTK